MLDRDILAMFQVHAAYPSELRQEGVLNVL